MDGRPWENESGRTLGLMRVVSESNSCESVSSSSCSLASRIVQVSGCGACISTVIRGSCNGSERRVWVSGKGRTEVGIKTEKKSAVT